VLGYNQGNKESLGN